MINDGKIIMEKRIYFLNKAFSYDFTSSLTITLNYRGEFCRNTVASRYNFYSTVVERCQLVSWVGLNLSCSIPQYVRVGKIMDWYIALADFRLRQPLNFASNLSLPDARLKFFSKIPSKL